MSQGPIIQPVIPPQQVQQVPVQMAPVLQTVKNENDLVRVGTFLGLIATALGTFVNAYQNAQTNSKLPPPPQPPAVVVPAPANADDVAKIEKRLDSIDKKLDALK